MYGWRARLGIIYPSEGTLEQEWYKFLPEGVSIHVARVGESREELDIVELALEGQIDLLKPAVTRLTFVEPDCIAFACTSGSFMKGVSHAERISKVLEEVAGIPVTTAASSSVKALKELGVERVAVATPYEDRVNEALKGFLEESGFEVVSMEGLQMVGAEMCALPPQRSYQLAREVDRPEADGVFISCTGFRTAEILEVLELDLGKPVVSANQAMIWDLLRMAGVKDRVKGYGRLLEEH